MLVRARAPLRISFAGGGTDVSPYAEEHGGAVLNATIDRYAYVTLKTREDGRFRISDLDNNTEIAGLISEDLVPDGHYDLAKAVVKRLNITQGFDLCLHADACWGTGLGSSSTHIVAVLGAFSHRLQLQLEDYDLAEMAYQIERQDLGYAGGRQDQYSATFGGFNFMEFGRAGTLVHPIKIKLNTVSELHYRLLLCSLGRTRRSAAILEDQVARYKRREADSVEALHRTRSLAYDMKRALLTGRIDDIGELLHQGWVQKRRFSEFITDSHIDELYEYARKLGALGGKVLGAGGGGHMLFVCPPEGKISLSQYLARRGVEPVPFSFEPAGLTVWEVSSEHDDRAFAPAIGLAEMSGKRSSQGLHS